MAYDTNLMKAADLLLEASWLMHAAARDNEEAFEREMPRFDRFGFFNLKSLAAACRVAAALQDMSAPKAAAAPRSYIGATYARPVPRQAAE